eukprot:TRINITY_DN5867_c0_g1_i1.p1 TRINITY_DN5867_c0_g1~~TRINITY_DN5867_c0_g1_i1.p1  ORF type:complete len:526 (+),score=231.18 TRINITY_DN5867_c0_g1_i1:200-1579(+)
MVAMLNGHTPSVPEKRPVSRHPLGELPANWEEQEDELNSLGSLSSPQTPMSPADTGYATASSIRELITRERFTRSKLIRMEVNASARLEMQLQNLNIKKNTMSQQTDLGASPSLRDRIVNRETGSDGKPIYTFEAGRPGGMCVYFLKGFCSLGNKCRYVHDDCDDGRFVKITGMPYEATHGDVIEFFKPIKLTMERITFIRNAGCKPSGSAIIEFADRNEALLAQSKDRSYITVERYVLLYPSSRMEQLWHQDKNEQRLRELQPKMMHMPTHTAHAGVMGQKPAAAHAPFTPMPFTPMPHMRASHTSHQQSPLYSTSTMMGLTPSPLLQMNSAATTPVSSSFMRQQAHIAEDDTMRNLLSTLNEADDEHQAPPSKAAPQVPSNLDWFSQLDDLTLAPQAPVEAQREATPSFTPTHQVIEALTGLGYDDSKSREIVKALQGVNMKSRQDEDDMPTLLPMA